MKNRPENTLFKYSWPRWLYLFLSALELWQVKFSYDDWRTAFRLESIFPDAQAWQAYIDSRFAACWVHILGGVFFFATFLIATFVKSTKAAYTAAGILLLTVAAAFGGMAVFPIFRSHAAYGLVLFVAFLAGGVYYLWKSRKPVKQEEVCK